MTNKTSWKVRGREASRRDVAEVLALGRQHKKRVADADREARERDQAARAVGAALRRAGRENDHAITCRPAAVRGSRKGTTRMRGFELRLNLLVPKRSYVGSNGFSSFHLKFAPRGRGSHRRAKDRPYRQGEAVVSVRYILRDAAREIEGGGVVSNIARAPDTIASFFAALEELELAGRANGNVYTGIIVSLPHELDGSGREALLRDICRPVADLGLPYVGVLHAPDSEGSSLNFHAHVMFSWRPFAVLPDGFSFASATLGSLNQRDFVSDFRERAAAAMNTAMTAAGHPRRFAAKQRDRKDADVSQDKHKAGRKHADRRRENIALGRAEKGWVDERLGVLAKARNVAQDVLLLDVVDRSGTLAALDQREIDVLRQKRRRIETASRQTPQVGMTPSPVSHEKPAVPAIQYSVNTVQRSPQMRLPGEQQTQAPAQAVVAPSITRRAIRRAGDAWRAKQFAAQPSGSLMPPISLARAPTISDLPGLSKAGALRDARIPGVILRGDRPGKTVSAIAPMVDPIVKATVADLPAEGIKTTPSPPHPLKVSSTAPKPEQEYVSEKGTASSFHVKAEEVDAILAALSAMSFLPLRPVPTDESHNRVRSFDLILEDARPEDRDVLRQAAALDDERLTLLYRQRWMAMLERVRALLMKRPARPPTTLTSALGRGDVRAASALRAEGWDTRLVAAVRAAGGSREFGAIVKESEAYWNKRALTRRTAARTSGSHAALRAEVKRRSVQHQATDEHQAADEQTSDTDLDILAAYMQGRGLGR